MCQVVAFHKLYYEFSTSYRLAGSQLECHLGTATGFYRPSLGVTRAVQKRWPRMITSHEHIQ